MLVQGFQKARRESEAPSARSAEEASGRSCGEILGGIAEKILEGLVGNVEWVGTAAGDVPSFSHAPRRSRPWPAGWQQGIARIVVKPRPGQPTPDPMGYVDGDRIAHQSPSVAGTCLRFGRESPFGGKTLEALGISDVGCDNPSRW